MAGDRLVYSTDGSRHPAPPGRAPAAPSRRARGPRAPDDGTVRVFRERAGRGGKVVTVIRGLGGGGAVLAAHAVELRRLCAAGGAVKADAVEIQGDHRERVAEHLRSQGYRVKLAGG